MITRRKIMIKQNQAKDAVKASVTPMNFVKACADGIAENPVYDWKTQRNSVMGYGTFRQTFSRPMEQWEND